MAQRRFRPINFPIPAGGAEINDLTAAVVWANVPDANIPESSVTQHVAAIDHDLLLNFLTAEHVDWAAAAAGTIHTDNYIENATHTGEVSGAGALTVGPTAISNRTLVTAVTGDLILVVDLTDGTLKKVNVSDFLGGGDMLIATYDPTAVGGDAFLMTNFVEGATNKIFTSTERTKLTGIETAATADQTAGEIEGIVNHDNLLGFLANEHIAEASLSIAETQIPDGSLLARLAADEVVTGNWDFSNFIEIIQSDGLAKDMLHLRDSTDTQDLVIRYDGAWWEVRTEQGGAGTRWMKFDTGQLVIFDGNVDIGAGLDVTGAITVTTTVDGRDIATDGTKLDGIETAATADQTSIVGITGTKAQFDTAVTDGSIAYVGGAHHDGFSDFVANEHIAEASLSIAETQIPDGSILARLASDEVITGAWSVPSTIVGTATNKTLVLTEAGKTIRFTGTSAGLVLTIPANSSVAFPIGTFIGVTNANTNDITVAITTDTLRWGADNSTGTRTLAPGADAVFQKVTATEWKINGSLLVT